MLLIVEVINMERWK